LGWSQEDLAHHSGVSRQIIARFENGSRNPHAANLQQLTSALRAAGVTVIRRKDGSAGVIASAAALQVLRAADHDDC
jgi:transcriptional regulator with XRE-family HTH domain